ncbi:alpha/beta hydrolase [Luteipulveratus mongoliensis]|uniref:BD-FAE-like domain-containing protein n=1 Tax=Luteipulveratus mongoliensis TaxID=571913 RepID=A0A0K1JGV7_9MICO|nr:alpha/beta hydrolase [Luteipulveratus mongoliensis]AKU15820.1 hypothetical protein VV02_08065 [Luteipulveratus mongoliensis]
MGIGYLITTLLSTFLTAAAVAPVRRTWALGQLSWRLGMQVNELPFLLGVWVLLSTGLAQAEGDVRTPIGAVGLVLAALTLVGLCIVVRRSLAAAPAVAEALRVGLGEDARSRGRRSWAPILLAPLPFRPRSVSIRRDISYDAEHPENVLDIYSSRTPVSGTPTLVYFHGGGYLSGRKSREARPLLTRLAGQGWVCATVDYRLSRTAPYPAALVDAKRAVAWMREHASTYGIDPGTVFVAGSSAGAHLAAMVALSPGAADLQPGFETADTQVAGAICLYGFYDTPTWIDREPGAPSSPLELVSVSAPPFFVAHGDRDSFVPVEDAREFVRCLRAVSSSPVVYAELPGGQHTFDLYHSLRLEAAVDGAEAFTSWVRDRSGEIRSAADRGLA